MEKAAIVPEKKAGSHKVAAEKQGNRPGRARRCRGVVLRVALVLCVSWIAAGTADAMIERTHTVHWGDTLARIAHRYYGDGRRYQPIAEANGLKSPHRIICGTVLTIPEEAGVETPATTSQDAPLAPAATATTTATAAATAAAVMSSPLELPAPEAEFLWRQEPYTVFDLGEKLTFAVRWKFITVGYATMEVRDIENISGRQAYHIVTAARSAPFFDNFYKVRDVNESWMDVESLCSLKFCSRISENSTKRDETILLDHEKQQFQIVESGKTGEIPRWVQDVLSSLYYLRNKELVIGKEISIDAHSGDKSWPLQVKVLRRETVEVPAGKFVCYVVEPAIRKGAGIFDARGTLQVWLTADDKKVPVMMRSKIAVGSIDALLTKMQLK
jgi:hypothetical protein